MIIFERSIPPALLSSLFCSYALQRSLSPTPQLAVTASVGGGVCGGGDYSGQVVSSPGRRKMVRVRKVSTTPWGSTRQASATFQHPPLFSPPLQQPRQRLGGSQPAAAAADRTKTYASDQPSSEIMEQSVFEGPFGAQCGVQEKWAAAAAAAAAAATASRRMLEGTSGANVDNIGGGSEAAIDGDHTNRSGLPGTPNSSGRLDQLPLEAAGGLMEVDGPPLQGVPSARSVIVGWGEASPALASAPVSAADAAPVAAGYTAAAALAGGDVVPKVAGEESDDDAMMADSSGGGGGHGGKGCGHGGGSIVPPSWASIPVADVLSTLY